MDSPEVMQLFKAVCAGNITEMKRLLDQGIDINIRKNDSFRTALLDVIYYPQDRLAVLDELLRRNINVNIHDHALGYTPLHRTVNVKMYDVFEKLLNHDSVNINLKAKLTPKSTPLQHAINFSENEFALKLLEKGADVNIQDENGETALIYAAIKDNPIIVEKILECPSVDVNLRTNDGRTVLYYIQDDERLIMKLLKKGAEINSKDRKQRTPLFHAIQFEKDHLFSALLKYDLIEFDYQDIYGDTPLYEAVKRNRGDFVNQLLQKGADVNRKYTSYEKTVLHLAVENNWESAFSALLKSNSIQIDPQDKYGYTPLYEAVIKNRSDFVKKLLQKGADINRKYGLETTVLHWAVDYDAEKTFSALLESNSIQVDPQEKYGRTPLFKAVSQDKGEFVRKLLEKGADVNRKYEYKTTVLHQAVQDDRKAAFSALLKSNSIQIDPEDEGGWTPLLKAVFQDNRNFVKELLQKGADVNRKYGGDMTALHYAIRFEKKEAFSELLKSNSIQVDPQDKGGWTPLLKAIFQDKDDFVEKLLEKGADVNKKNKDMNTALHITILKNKSNILFKLMKSKSTELDPRDKDGNTPLLRAIIEGGRYNIIRILVQREVDVNARNSDNKTPLLLAASKGNNSAVESLLSSNSIKVNLQDTTGITALHYAASRGDRDIVSLILKKKDVKLDLQDNNKATPLHLATKNGHHMVVADLLKARAREDIKDNENRIPADYIKNNQQMKMVFDKHKPNKDNKGSSSKGALGTSGGREGSDKHDEKKSGSGNRSGSGSRSGSEKSGSEKSGSEKSGSGSGNQSQRESGSGIPIR